MSGIQGRRRLWLHATTLIGVVLAAIILSPRPVSDPSSVEGNVIVRWSEDRAYEAGDRVSLGGRTWEAQEAAAAGHAPLGVGDGSDADQRLLLSRREGFGRRVTGGFVQGSNSEVVHVTTAADRGPGSLRQAVSGDEPRWIVFDGDYHIRLRSGLLVGSNKTIDGRGRNVLIQAPDDGDEDNWGLIVDHESNVIVHNIRIDECGDYTRQALNDRYDCIDLEAARGVWIDHVTLSQAVDKLIDVQIGSRRITVSWSRFRENAPEANDTDYAQQVFQIGSGWAGEHVESLSTVTSHHNFFDDTGYRHPVVSYGKVHAYNNYVYSFQLYGMQSQRRAQLLAEGNIFENTDEVLREATKFDVDGTGCTDDGSFCDDRNGFVRAVNNVVINARINTYGPASVFDPPYRYQLDQPGDPLRTLLIGFSGWQPAVWEPVP